MSEAEITAAAISALSNMLLAGAAIAAAVAAFMGLNTWRAQNIWLADRDLARLLLKALVKLEKTLANARSPAFWAGETAAFSDEGRKDRVDAAHRVRLNRIHSVYEEIEALLIEAEAVWGEAINDQWKSITSQLVRFFATTEHYWSWKEAGQPNEPNGFFETAADRQRVYDVVFVAPGEDTNNLFSQDFAKAAADLKAVLREKLGKPK